jgi:ABC-type multidrug transport system fused ATPase/permease subunit
MFLFMTTIAPAIFVSYCSTNICVVSRIQSDTQLVQDGLSSSVSAFIKAFCTIVGMVVIMFTYSWKLTLYALLLISPSIFSNRIFMSFYKSYNEAY